MNTLVFSITSNSIFSFSFVSCTCIVQYVQQGNNVMLKATMTKSPIWWIALWILANNYRLDKKYYQRISRN